VPPTDVPNVGRFAVINDAHGATFSLIQMTARGEAR
jgi:predicted enzyme related to lactoylglutathione lyase